jgi:endonuclease/exonuclease/phosphatase family metal-dependent hydrolase
VRIGSWNLQGRWDQRHHDQIIAMCCDILLLTEVSERVQLPGVRLHATSALMAPRRRWAAVASRQPLHPLPDPHGASAMAEIDGLRVCSSILPWRSCGTQPPWTGSTTAAKTESAVASIEAVAPTVWGGDWNHAMSGREWSGSQPGRRSILEAVDRLGLQLPTEGAPHQIPGLLSIDHIAVPTSWTVLKFEHHPAFSNGARISDHDAYVVEV